LGGGAEAIALEGIPALVAQLDKVAGQKAKLQEVLDQIGEIQKNRKTQMERTQHNLENQLHPNDVGLCNSVEA